MDSSRYLLDSHKLMYHPDRVAEWLATGDTRPITMEVSPTSVCNHRCRFCSFQYMDHPSIRIGREVGYGLIADARRIGIKAILYSGEGEPLLNKHVPSFIELTSRMQIDSALVTNGVLLTPSVFEAVGKYLTWMRFSVDAATSHTHSIVHGTSEVDYDTIISNVFDALTIRKLNGWKCTIGAQFVIVPDNYTEIAAFANLLKDSSIDYISYKPYYKHHMNDTPYDNIDIDMSIIDRLIDEARGTCKNNSIEIIHRTGTMADNNSLSAVSGCRRCYAMPFFVHVDAHGDVYWCNRFVGDTGYSMGNVNDTGLYDIWYGDRRRAMLDRYKDGYMCYEPSVSCRNDKMNSYLESIISGTEHINFV